MYLAIQACLQKQHFPSLLNNNGINPRRTTNLKQRNNILPQQHLNLQRLVRLTRKLNRVIPQPIHTHNERTRPRPDNSQRCIPRAPIRRPQHPAQLNPAPVSQSHATINNTPVQPRRPAFETADERPYHAVLGLPPRAQLRRDPDLHFADRDRVAPRVIERDVQRIGLDFVCCCGRRGVAAAVGAGGRRCGEGNGVEGVGHAGGPGVALGEERAVVGCYAQACGTGDHA